jgi:Flp pilus assembly protein TadD
VSPLPRRTRFAARLLLLLAPLALVGCGGVPAGSLLAESVAEGAGPEAASARSGSLARLADTALQTGETETAAGFFEEALMLDGRNEAAALGLGTTLLVQGRDLDASRAFERALSIRPDSAAAHVGYARAMIALRRPEDAVEHLRAALDMRPDEPMALNALGIAYDLQAQHELAAETYRKGLAVAPALVPLRNNLALSLALEGRFDEAVATLRPIAEGPAATRRTRQNLALVYGLKGDLEAAERLGRTDLGEDDLRRNLAYFAAVRGLQDSAAKAAALAPSSNEQQSVDPLAILPAAGGTLPEATPGEDRASLPRALTPAIAARAVDALP